MDVLPSDYFLQGKYLSYQTKKNQPAVTHINTVYKKNLPTEDLYRIYAVTYS